MSRFTQPAHKKPWPLLAGIAVVAVSAWGVYIWKSAGRTELAESASPQPAVAAAGQARSDQVQSGDLLTPLRATIPQKPANGVEDLSSVVRPNSPVSIGDPVGITIPDRGPIEPDISLSPRRSAAGAGATAAAAVSAARQALGRGDQVAARALFSRALGRGLPEAEASSIRAELANLADALLFSRARVPNDPLTGVHVISSGEVVHNIARRYKITDQLLCAINHITDPSRVNAGLQLKVIRGPFHAVIYKSQHRLDVYLHDIFVRSFSVGLGTNGGTPLGRWVIKNKLTNPEWTDPRNGQHYLSDDPDNPIGERWIGLDCVAGDCLGRVGFGIHGTIDPKSIGANLSMGCVRLVPDDVALLYDLLVRNQSRVDIRP